MIAWKVNQSSLVILYMVLIGSAKNFTLQPRWRVFVLLRIHAFKHSIFISNTIMIFI